MSRPPNQHARRTTRLSYDEIPTRLASTYILCVAPGRSGPVFWPAYIPTIRPKDLAHAVDWDTGIQLLRENGLTIGLDDRGFAGIRYVDDRAREEAQWARREIASRRLRDP